MLRDWGSEMEGFMAGIFVGLVMGVLIYTFALSGEDETCQRENNVYKCERVYIPVKGED